MNSEKIHKLYDQIIEILESIHFDLKYNETQYIEENGKPEGPEDIYEMQSNLYETYINIPYKGRLLYNCINVLLEELTLNNYLEQFQYQFSRLITDEKFIFKTTYVDQIDAVVYDIYHNINEFLYPITVQLTNEKNDTILENNKKILENILASVPSSLRKSRSPNPQKEKDIHSFLYTLISSSFPSVEHIPQIQFIKKIKSYQPDIFIPDCKSVIEVKYINTEKDLISCIEQIDTDIKGYTDNQKYQYFYAFFFCDKAYISKPRFDELWKERKYPKNWIPVYSVLSP